MDGAVEPFVDANFSEVNGQAPVLLAESLDPLDDFPRCVEVVPVNEAIREQAKRSCQDEKGCESAQDEKRSTQNLAHAGARQNH